MSKKKCIVFIQRTFPVGGIETLVVRITRNLLEKQCDVVVCGTQGEMSELLPSDVDFFPINGYMDLIRKLPSHLRLKYSSHDYILVSLHPRSLLAAYVLRHLLGGGSVQSFHLVTHSRAFFFDTKFPFLNYQLKSAFFHAPPTSTYFMTDSALKAHESEWRMDLSGYPVIRLPLNIAEPTWAPKSRHGLKVVSVGRLVPFKAYNYSAPSIVRKLIDSGMKISWDIYGDGEDQDRIEAEIARQGVRGIVSLKGSIPYADLLKTIDDYDVFVGLGTALLEAAQLGMPSICAIDADGDNSYGLFYEVPSDSIGDIVADHARIQIIDVLKFLNGRTPEELKSIGLKCAESVAKRSEGVGSFTDAILESGIWRVSYGFRNLALLLSAYAFFILFDIRYRNK